jgi:hypothetical protein
VIELARLPPPGGREHWTASLLQEAARKDPGLATISRSAITEIVKNASDTSLGVGRPKYSAEAKARVIELARSLTTDGSSPRTGKKKLLVAAARKEPGLATISQQTVARILEAFREAPLKSSQGAASARVEDPEPAARGSNRIAAAAAMRGVESNSPMEHTNHAAELSAELSLKRNEVRGLSQLPPNRPWQLSSEVTSPDGPSIATAGGPSQPKPAAATPAEEDPFPMPDGWLDKFA